MRGLSLFSGIGGLDLAFEWAGGTVAAMCEINKYCSKVLKKHWPDVPIFKDIRGLHGDSIGTVDIIYGGFPCQPFSVAGNKKGKNDNRYLWPEFSRLVGELKPRWVVAENVPGILRLAADDVCSDLERQGYSVGIWDFEAAAVGAKHRRERIFFVAHARRKLHERSDKPRNLRTQTKSRNAAQSERTSGTFIPDTDSSRCQEQREPVRLQSGFSPPVLCGRWETEPRLGGDVNGLPSFMDGSRISPVVTSNIPHRADRLRALGNAVVPQQAYPIFKAIMEVD